MSFPFPTQGSPEGAQYMASGSSFPGSASAGFWRGSACQDFSKSQPSNGTQGPLR